eukprot:TRINITY_DN779891_c0_g1_i1.p1 TRINITY_DN779891_c0_g1~~TRINITY_DN779891_c0_g1_i1.p1  ORF type:complete len:560 (+),score=202.62 TRINITY_DN779891_c0_g1_i1:31-1680(+)
MNPNASAFNPNAAAFTPSFLAPPAPRPVQQQPIQAAPVAPKPAPVEEVAAKVEELKVSECTDDFEIPEELKEEAPKKVEKKVEIKKVEVPVEKKEVVKKKSKKNKTVDVKELLAGQDERQHLNVVFIGHVDAGKSSLSGQILYLTGCVDERTIRQYEKQAKNLNRESWFLAFIMDTSEEERAKGKTVEVGRATFETADKRFTILDAPGHKDYVPNMISGASQADVGVLVISARSGEFEAGFEKGGQTREHTMLAKTLGINRLIVVINKLDTCEYAKERYDECKSKLLPFLKSQCNFNTKKNVFFVPISAINGGNIKEPFASGLCPWYKGPTLIDTLNKLPVSDRDPTAPLRMPILDGYADRGGIIAMGKVEAGAVYVGQKLMVQPVGESCEVTAIEVESGEVTAAKPGENVTLRLKGITEENVQKGFVLCDPERPCHVATRFDCQIVLLELLEHRSLFTAGYEAVFHIHTAVEDCRLEKILKVMDRKTGKAAKGRPTYVRSHNVLIGTMELDRSVCVEEYKTMPQLGRFTLRDERRTIAIGKIMKVHEM